MKTNSTRTLAVLVAGATMLASSAAMAESTISGTVYPSGKTDFSNTTLTQTATITQNHVDGKWYCIKRRGVMSPVMCSTEANPSLVGQTLPAGTGYYAQAEPHIRGGYSQVSVQWSY